jgi:ubiquinol-cytochrome c reductase cytochrome c1 subunit
MKSILKKSLFAAAFLAAGLGLSAGKALAAGDTAHVEDTHFSFDGFFGHWDKAQLQRGFQVYNEVCSSCHSLHLVAFRNLAEIGFNEDEVKAIAAQYTVLGEPDFYGDVVESPAVPSDRIRGKGVAENAPDLSLMGKARVGGPDYLKALLAGYEEAPADVEVQSGLYYNPYFPGHQIAMPPPLAGDDVSYADGTPTTVEQEAEDVAAFLMWSSEPMLEERKRTGIKVILFLIVFTGLLYAVKRKVWADLH